MVVDMGIMAPEGLGLVMAMELLRRSLVEGLLRFLVLRLRFPVLRPRFPVDLHLRSLVEVDQGSLGYRMSMVGMGITMIINTITMNMGVIKTNMEVGKA